MLSAWCAPPESAQTAFFERGADARAQQRVERLEEVIFGPHLDGLRDAVELVARGRERYPLSSASTWKRPTSVIMVSSSARSAPGSRGATPPTPEPEGRGPATWPVPPAPVPRPKAAARPAARAGSPAGGYHTARAA